MGGNKKSSFHWVLSFVVDAEGMLESKPIPDSGSIILYLTLLDNTYKQLFYVGLVCTLVLAFTGAGLICSKIPRGVCEIGIGLEFRTVILMATIVDKSSAYGTYKYIDNLCSSNSVPKFQNSKRFARAWEVKKCFCQKRTCMALHRAGLVERTHDLCQNQKSSWNFGILEFPQVIHKLSC